MLHPRPRRLAALMAVAALLTATAACTTSCASSAGSRVVGVETAAIQSIHLVVQAEKTAYDNGAFDRVQHRKNLEALKRIIDHEAALNDSLIVWANGGQIDSPAIVKQVIVDLQLIVNDVQALQHEAPAVAVDTAAKTGQPFPKRADPAVVQPLLTALANALAKMTPGGGGAEIDLTAKEH